MIDCVIFDIDGTIADNSNRIHYISTPNKDWESYNNETNKDTPMHAMLSELKIIGQINPIVLLTGRVESTRKVTLSWLRANGIDYAIVSNPKELTRKHIYLVMRANDDRDENYIYKRKQVQQMKNNGLNPILAYDDDIKCRKMFRDFGIRVIDPAVVMRKHKKK